MIKNEWKRKVLLLVPVSYLLVVVELEEGDQNLVVVELNQGDQNLVVVELEEEDDQIQCIYLVERKLLSKRLHQLGLGKVNQVKIETISSKCKW